MSSPTPGHSLSFAWSWERSELVEIAAGRVRPVGVLMAELAVVVVLVSVLSTWEASWWQLMAIGVAGGAIGLAVAVVLDAWVFWRSCWRWFQVDGRRRVGACVRLRGGRATVLCVHAVPRGAGLGGQVMAQVCAWSDEIGQDLHLKASGAAAARFYGRFGFVQACGRRMVRSAKVISESVN